MNFNASVIYVLSICAHFNRKYLEISYKKCLFSLSFPWLSVPHFNHLIFCVSICFFFVLTFSFRKLSETKWRKNDDTKKVLKRERENEIEWNEARKEQKKYTYIEYKWIEAKHETTYAAPIFIDPVDVCVKFNICHIYSVWFCCCFLSLSELL